LSKANPIEEILAKLNRDQLLSVVHNLMRWLSGHSMDDLSAIELRAVRAIVAHIEARSGKCSELSVREAAAYRKQLLRIMDQRQKAAFPVDAERGRRLLEDLQAAIQ